MSTVNCPECDAEITLDANAEVGEIIVCPDCGVDLEVTLAQPRAGGACADGTGRLGRVDCLIRPLERTMMQKRLKIGVLYLARAGGREMDFWRDGKARHRLRPTR